MPSQVSVANGASAYDRLTKRLEWPMVVLAFATVPALVLEERSATPWLRTLASALNWTIWVGFVGEYVARLVLAPDRRAFVRSAWFDLLIIVLSPPFLVPESMESLRAARVLRLLRLLRVVAVAAIGFRHLRTALAHRRFHWVALVAMATVLVGAVAEYAVEGRGNGSLTSFGDSLWWAVVTATTVGYGDLSPETTEGRVIAVMLMLVGIGVIGVFTATLASFVLSSEETEASVIHTRLDAIERKLDDLLARDRGQAS
jgi:voltage-gated potassium channel